MLTFEVSAAAIWGAILSGVAKLENGRSSVLILARLRLIYTLHERCGLRGRDDEIEVAQQADVILIAVKPQHVQA